MKIFSGMIKQIAKTKINAIKTSSNYQNQKKNNCVENMNSLQSKLKHGVKKLRSKDPVRMTFLDPSTMTWCSAEREEGVKERVSHTLSCTIQLPVAPPGQKCQL